MKNHFSRRALCGLGAATLVAIPVLAQPGPPRDGGRDGGRPHGGPGQNRPDGRGNFGPDGRLRDRLQRAGYSSPSLLEAVMAFQKNKMDARKPLMDATRALEESIDAKSDAKGDARGDAQGAWNAWNRAVVAERTRARNAEINLDAKIHYRQDPKLWAVLTLSGVVGEARGILPPPPMGMGHGGPGGPDGGRSDGGRPDGGPQGGRPGGFGGDDHRGGKGGGHDGGPGRGRPDDGGDDF